MATTSDNKIEVASKFDEGRDVAQIERSTAEPVVKVDSYRDDHHINLTWRSWMVVL